MCTLFCCFWLYICVFICVGFCCCFSFWGGEGKPYPKGNCFFLDDKVGKLGIFHWKILGTLGGQNLGRRNEVIPFFCLKKMYL